MESIPTFITEFARLLWQLTREPRAVEEQKATLRRVMLAREPQGVEIELGALNIAIVASRGAGGLPEGVAWLSELTTRMAAHAVRSIVFEPQVPALEVLGVARALAAPPQLRDDGQAFDARIVALKLTAVTLRIGREGIVRHATPRAGMHVVGSPSPAAGARVITRLTSNPLADRSTPTRGAPPMSMRPGSVTPRATGITEDRIAMMSHDVTRSEPMRDLSALTKLLAEATDADSATIAAAEAVRAAEQRIHGNDWTGAASIAAALAQRDDPAVNPEIRRAFLIALRRLLSPGTLRALAKLLPTNKELRVSLHAIFARSSEDGVDALVELMTNAGNPGERRAYRDALAACPHAAPTLGHMLGDPQWYVVRNAAELLGEMGAVEVDGRLVETLTHPDARVRRAATSALARLGTARALHALQEMLQDPNPDIRRQAALGLGAAAQRAACGDLLAALDKEEDNDVQHALITALGKVATPEAVDRLARLARPGTLFRRKPVATRIAAVNALAEAATDEAVAVLQTLSDDRDGEVRGAVERALRSKSAL